MNWSQEPCIHLRSHHGKYLAGEDNYVLNANRNGAASWETFQIIHKGGNKVAFLTDHGKYLCCESNNNNKIIANRDHIGAWEIWTMIKCNNDDEKDGSTKYGIQSHNGKYLSSNENGIITMSGHLQAWEKWNIIKSNNTQIGYKIYGNGASKIYHTSIYLYGKEYYWHNTNKVEIGECMFVGGPYIKYRSKYINNNDKNKIIETFNSIVNDWNKHKFGKYNLIENNCNDFTNYVLKTFNLGGIDNEYLQKNELRKLVKQIPGAQTIAGLLNHKADQGVWNSFCDEIHLNKNVEKGISHAHNQAKKEIQKVFKW